MITSESSIKAYFEESFKIFLRDESTNILSGVSERSLCCRLAMALNARLSACGFETYYVDTEYNKNNGRVKTFLGDNNKPVRINCDVIVHTRGQSVSNDNLITIEMKKSEEEKEKDRQRLMALTKRSYNDVWSNDGVTLPEHVCGYKLGVYLELYANKRSWLVEYYQDGSRVAECWWSFGS